MLRQCWFYGMFARIMLGTPMSKKLLGAWLRVVVLVRKHTVLSAALCAFASSTAIVFVSENWVPEVARWMSTPPAAKVVDVTGPQQQLQLVSDQIAVKLKVPAATVVLLPSSSFPGQTKCDDSGCRITLGDAFLDSTDAKSGAAAALLLHEYGHVLRILNKNEVRMTNYFVGPVAAIMIVLFVSLWLWPWATGFTIAAVATLFGNAIALSPSAISTASPVIALTAYVTFAVVATFLGVGKTRPFLMIAVVWLLGAGAFAAGNEYRNSKFRPVELEADRLAYDHVGSVALEHMLCIMQVGRKRGLARQGDAEFEEMFEPYRLWVDVHPANLERAQALGIRLCQ